MKKVQQNQNTINQLNQRATLELLISKAPKVKHPFGAFGEGIVLANGKPYFPSPAEVLRAERVLLPYVVSFYVSNGRVPSAVEAQQDLGITSIDRVRKMFHILIGRGHLSKSPTGGYMQLVGNTDQKGAASVLKGVDAEFLKTLDALPDESRKRIISMIKFVAVSKWVLPIGEVKWGKGSSPEST